MHSSMQGHEKLVLTRASVGHVRVCNMHVPYTEVWGTWTSKSYSTTICGRGNVCRDLKGQCHEIWLSTPVFGQTNSSWTPYEQAKTVSRNCSIFVKLFAKNMCFRWLHWHGVVVDYEDTTLTTRTATANFECFSQTLKEQWLKICKVLGCVSIPIAIFWSYENGGLTIN